VSILKMWSLPNGLILEWANKRQTATMIRGHPVSGRLRTGKPTAAEGRRVGRVAPHVGRLVCLCRVAARASGPSVGRRLWSQATKSTASGIRSRAELTKDTNRRLWPSQGCRTLSHGASASFPGDPSSYQR